MRVPFIAGNWKMFTTTAVAEHLAADVVRGVGDTSKVSVALFPPFPYLQRVATILHGSPVELGAQNVYPEKEGAFTGEVGTTMLQDAGCRFVIVGHSERRHKLGETNDFINRKVHAALAAGLNIILCVGETMEEHDRDQTEAVLDDQLTSGLAGLSRDAVGSMVLAYEPVWAIGTGRNATPAQAQQAHAFLRRRVADIHGPAAAEALRIQYGGSVKPENAASLLHQPDVDGALVGGASLIASQFLAIIHAALPNMS
jgi:triosephosphate isomerase (TIM)